MFHEGGFEFGASIDFYSRSQTVGPSVQPTITGEITAKQPRTEDGFARYVAITDVTAAVGSSLKGDSLAVFRYHDDRWNRRAALHPGDQVTAVATTQKAIVVGTTTGGIIYERSDGTWTETARVPSETPVRAVAIDGGKAAFGIPDELASGGVWFWERTPDGWSDTDVVAVPDGPGKFGTAVTLTHGTALVSALTDADSSAETPAGTVYVYEYTDDEWVSRPAPQRESDRHVGFGTALDFDGTTAIIGAPYDNRSGEPSPQGAAYVYEYTGSKQDGKVWAERARLDFTGINRGKSVGVADDIAVASGNAGVTTIVQYAGVWTRRREFSEAELGGDLGPSVWYPVAVSGRRGLVGVPARKSAPTIESSTPVRVDNSRASPLGAAYVIRLLPER